MDDEIRFSNLFYGRRDAFQDRFEAQIRKRQLESRRPRFRVCVEGFDTSLPADDMKKALINHFNSCGNILHVYFKDRCAFVIIRGEDAEDKALELNGSDLGGCNVSVKVSPIVLPPERTPQESEAFIAACNDPKYRYGIGLKIGYDTSVPDDDLKIKVFSSCGDITHVYIPPRGDRCTFVYFAEEEALDRALKLGKVAPFSGKKDLTLGKTFETGSELRVWAAPRMKTDPSPGPFATGYTIPPHCIEIANNWCWNATH